MKKLLIMISAFVLTSISTNQLVESLISNHLLSPIIKKENKKYDTVVNEKSIKEDSNINWNEVEKYFKDENNKNNNQYNGINFANASLIKKTIDEVFAKALEYTKEFKIKNMSLDKIITKFKDEIPKFNIVYEREINKILTKNNFNKKLAKEMDESKLPTLNQQEEKQLRLEATKFWDKLNTVKKDLAIAIVIAATIAAAFWALAWAGGISIPWAVAATTAAATMGVMLSGLNIYLAATNPYMNKILQGAAITLNAGLLVYEFVTTVMKILTIGTIVLSGTSVLMPAFTSIAAFFIALYYWIGQTSIFKQLDIYERYNDNINEVNESNKPPYQFDFNFIHDGTGIKKEIKETVLLEWTKYDVSKNEFLKNYKHLFFDNSKAFLGDKEDNQVWENFLYQTYNIEEKDNNHFIPMFEYVYNPWWVPCAFQDRLSFNTYFENDNIIAKYEFAIGTSCFQTNYIRLSYKSVKVVL